ncbi:MAG: 1-acyl-sn-glycerol-3-phosphate acyltransferase, partial [Pseudomonadota bacterium]
MKAIRSFPLLTTIFEEGGRALFKLYFRLVHRIKIEGEENSPKNFDKLIIIANHESLLDGLIIWTYLGLRLKIIVDRTRAQERLLKPFMQNAYTIQIDSMNPYSLKG